MAEWRTCPRPLPPSRAVGTTGAAVAVDPYTGGAPAAGAVPGTDLTATGGPFQVAETR
jgi:hypothetical protein